MHKVDIDKEYLEFIESDEGSAPDIVMTGYKGMKEAFECYLDSLVEYEWKAGYAYALRMMEKREAV